MCYLRCRYFFRFLLPYKIIVSQIERRRNLSVYLLNHMDETKLKNLFPRGSKSFFGANSQLCSEKLERASRPALERPASGETKSDDRVSLRYVLYRVRLLDPDNAVGATKTVTDCLCEVGIIPGDAANQITLTVEQVKVAHRIDERTELHIHIHEAITAPIP